MPKNNRSNRSRSDITGTVEHLKQEYEEKTDALGRTTQDVTIERETIQGMIMVGTMEGMEAVMAALQEAEGVSQEEFTEQADALNGLQVEGTEFEGELQERTESTLADLDKLERAQSELNSKAAGSSMERAESQVQDDCEFLRSEDSRERTSREAAQQECEQLRVIVFGGGG